MAAPALSTLSLCTGGGGLELGLSLVVRTHVVGYVERDAYAASVLLARMGDEALAPAPVWCGDLADLDAGPTRGVDLVCAGFPCPPFSSAGRRRGTDDDRWLWPEIARVLRDVGPRFVFLENVRGLLVPSSGQLAGLGHVLRDLATLGFDAEWGCLRASDAGAPHQRERVFILAYRHGDRLGAARRSGRDDGNTGGLCPALADAVGGRHDGRARDEGREPVGGTAAERPGPYVADAGGVRRQQVAGGAPGDEGPDAGRPTLNGDQPQRGVEAVADADGGRGPARQRPGARAAERSEPQWGVVVLADTEDEGREGERLCGFVAHAGSGGVAVGATTAGRASTPTCAPGIWPPGPDDADGWRRLLAACPGAEPSLRRDADGLASQLDRLRVLGNGCVPQQVALAFYRLARRAGVW